MNIEEIINKVPNYESFLTVEEMDASTRSLQENYPDIVSVKLVGHSRKGHPIECITIGTGELQALCFALPHPNEPIGAMTMEFLTKELAENESLRDSLNFTWHIIKCIDPDGTRLNEGWFKGPFDIFTYSRNFYRPGGHEQVEWTFPISYKTLDFNSPIPETKALMNLIEEIQPDFMYSLHNAGFGGAYWYITHDLPELYEDLRNSALKQEVPLNLGEPEAPFIKEFSPAVFKMMSAIDEYEHTLKYTGKAPKRDAGTSSADYAKQFNEDCVTFLTELPYFYDERIDDESETSRTRREVIYENVENTRAHYSYVSELIKPVWHHISSDNPFLTLVDQIITHLDSSTEAKINWANENPEFSLKATTSQVVDNLLTAKFYQGLFLGMTVRAFEYEHSRLLAETGTDVEELKQSIELGLKRLDELCGELEESLNYKVIPIQKLVKIQVEGGLRIVNHLREKATC